MKISKTNAMREIEKAGISYQAHVYDHGDGAIDGVSVAHKLGQNPDQVFKTLVTQATSKQYYVFVIPVAKELNLKAAARAVGEKAVEMIPVKEINKVTGYIRGGCTPIGMKKKYPTVIDETALGQESIMISAGKIGMQIQVNPRDLISLIGASTSHIAEG